MTESRDTAGQGNEPDESRATNERLAESIADGLRGLVRLARRVSPDQESMESNCSPWTVLDVLRHVVCNLEVWAELLDAEEAGEPAPFQVIDQKLLDEAQLAQVESLVKGGVDIRDMDAENERRLRSAVGLSLADVVTRLETDGAEFVSRTRAGQGDARYKVIELHLHAHDVADAIGEQHTPADEELVVGQFAANQPEVSSWPELLIAAGRSLAG